MHLTSRLRVRRSPGGTAYNAGVARLIPLVAIVGPTAAGKSALAMALAPRFDGEIVGADSRHVYRGLDVGTGKPNAADRARIPHHLIDVVEPDAEFSVAHYQEQAAAAISGIHERGRLPLLVGGSGHYVRALLEGYRLPKVPPDPELRRELSARAASEGPEGLLRELEALDPVSAARIDPRNTRRLVRAIEVSRAVGRPFSEVGGRGPSPYHALVIGVTAPRPELYRRIDARVDDMIAADWAGEVRGLLERGLDASLPSMSSLGYPVMVEHVRDGLALDEAARRIQLLTHRFARRQYTWFKPSDERIRWIDGTKDDHAEAAEALVRKFLECQTSA